MSFDLHTKTTQTSQSVTFNTLNITDNKVLRQTYILLAISLLPTILGAAIGVYTGFSKVMMMSPLMTMGIFFVGSFFMMYMIEKNNTRSSGIAWLMGFTLFMGVMLSRIIDRTLNFTNGSELIMLAVGGTAGIFATMAGLSSFIKRDLSFMGKFLTIATVALFVVAIASVFLNIPGFTLILTVMLLVLFSVYLMYDLNQIIHGGETNYIRATLSIYLNLYNIFSTLLSLLGIGGNKE